MPATDGLPNPVTDERQTLFDLAKCARCREPRLTWLWYLFRKLLPA
jgi:hypothetical protein